MYAHLTLTSKPVPHAHACMHACIKKADFKVDQSPSSDADGRFYFCADPQNFRYVDSSPPAPPPGRHWRKQHQQLETYSEPPPATLPVRGQPGYKCLAEQDALKYLNYIRTGQLDRRAPIPFALAMKMQCVRLPYGRFSWTTLLVT